MLAVDHDERRERIAEVAVDVIARDGLDAATIRRIATEVGCSTTIVTHYFCDKQQVLLWAYRALARQGHRRVDEVISRDPTDLVGALVAMTAADESSMRRWRVYVAFWEWAARDPVIAEEQRKNTDVALRCIDEIVRARNPDHGDVANVSRLLNALVQGISVQALVDQKRWSVEQIRSTLAHQVEMVLGKPAMSP